MWSFKRLSRTRFVASELRSARSHARLAPSAAHRWMRCPGSIRESEGCESTSGPAAREGTAAHELAAVCLRGERDAQEFLGWGIDIELGRIAALHGDMIANHTHIVTQEMADSVQAYLDVCRERTGIAYRWGVEQEVDLSFIPGMESGTVDFMSFNPAENCLRIVDFKYGRTPVEVVRNPQLMVYALGVSRLLAGSIDKFEIVIVQPRVRAHAESYFMDAFDMEIFEANLCVAARDTYDPGAKLTAGDWCRFCPAQPIKCQEVKRQALVVAQSAFEVVTESVRCSPELLSDLMGRVSFAKRWIAAVENYAVKEALAGRPPAGMKAVEKRATRKWRDEGKAAEAILKACPMFDESEIEERHLSSPAVVEKLIGKKCAARILPELVSKVSSGVALVALSDPRPPVSKGGEAIAVFANMEEGEE